MENVHQQQFSAKLCGRDLVLEEGLETGLEGGAELHGRLGQIGSGQVGSGY
jgi:hypothetical protein